MKCLHVVSLELAGLDWFLILHCSSSPSNTQKNGTQSFGSDEVGRTVAASAIPFVLHVVERQ